MLRYKLIKDIDTFRKICLDNFFYFQFLKMDFAIVSRFFDFYFKKETNTKHQQTTSYLPWAI